MYICGQWETASGGRVIEVINPANGMPVGTVPAAAAADVDRAVNAADSAFQTWKDTTPFHRGELLRRSAGHIEEASHEIARCMTLEQGKPFAEALGEVKKGAEILRFYAEEGERVEGRILPAREAGVTSRVLYEPIGPCAAISPWNYPIELLAWKLGAALAAGCTIVCKLPSETPLAPLLFIEAVVRAGYPDGVVNALTGSGSLVGNALVRHPLIKKVAFTGSTAVGRSIAAAAAEGLKKVSLELGGSLPMLVFDDCDLEAAAKGAARRSFRNMGQICIAVNRIYVQKGVYQAFLEAFAEKTRALTIGDGATDECDLGPMCTKKGWDKAAEHVEDARQRGGQILCGGRKPQGDKFADGFFYEPTIIANATHDMLVMREETFGPVVGVMPFDTLEEGLRLANDSPYGLAAVVYTQSLATAEKATRGLDAGNVAVNNPDPGAVNAPYGGRKESGYGYEHGREGLQEYLKIKHVRLKACEAE